MSLQHCFRENDYQLFCDKLTCNSIGSNCIHNCVNIGSGSQVFKQLSGTDQFREAEFRTLTAGSNITLVQNANDIQISASDTGITNGINNGGGEGIFQNVSGTDMNFKTLVAGTNITLTPTADTITIASTGTTGNYISTTELTTPGAANIIVPALAKRALISAVGGGGSGANVSSGNGLGGGGAGGGIIDYPIGVSPGQSISCIVGAGGPTSNTDGTDTVITVGTLVITCQGGKKGLFANPMGVGGDGGSVILSYATLAGGAGGSSSVGSNGTNLWNIYSGAGGGSGTDPTGSFAGGNCLLFTGGAIQSGRYGGGGASCFGNGKSVNDGSSGGPGGGGPGNVNGIVSGIDGKIVISFYSS